MHTGNVIHNHYHLPPTPQPAQQPPPQAVIYSGLPPQSIPYQQPQQLFIPYKKIHAFDWVVYGVISILFAFFPGVNICCGLVSGVGILSMLPHLHKSRNKLHPESGKIVPAIVLNSIALFLSIFVMILMGV
jgi:hypothetical protein